MKKIFLIIVMFVFAVIPCFSQENQILPSQLGIVRNVEYVDLNQGDYLQTKQIAEVELLKGENKGTVINVDNVLTGSPGYDIKLKKGMKVIMHAEIADGDVVYSVEDIKRSGTLTFLSLLFCGLLVLIGRKKGLYSLVSICLTCCLIFFLLSPMIIAGIHPVAGTLITCLLATAATMYLVGGFNKKSTSATIGCVLSLFCASLLSLVVVKTASLTGYVNENSLFLYAAHPELNFTAIVISTMMLATLGAVMDVGMSIASTINEIYAIDNTKSIKELFFSGMNVGRDIIGTMANTLILVYLGSALPLILLASNIDLQKFFNLNQVVTEIASALIGSSAIIICVPITAIVASELISKIPEKIDFSNIGK